MQRHDERQLLQMQQQDEQRRIDAEQRRVDHKRFFPVLAKQKVESDNLCKVLAESLKANTNDAASSNEQIQKNR